MNDKPIAFFDSGIGGTTILKEVMKLLPYENYIYYPDTKNNPYGNKTKDEIFLIVDEIIKKLLIYNPKIIVFACNTATAMVINKIRKKYNDIIFVGTEPSIKTVFDKYNNLKSIILTTKGTKESERFKKLYSKYKTNNSILVEAPLLAELIENNKETYSYLYELLNKYNDVDLVVLGCTHFPLVKNEIKKILGNVKFVDGRLGIAKRIKQILTENDMFNNNNNNNKHSNIKILSKDDKIKKRILNIINNSL